MAFHLTQGTFSYLPPLTDAQIRAQIEYALKQGWAVSVELTDDPHPKNFLWDMWELPMFDQQDAAAVLFEVNACRNAYPHHYIRLNAYDARYGRQTTVMSFIVNRPPEDPGFRLERQFSQDRIVRYTLSSYAADRPKGERLGEQ